jgi:cellulose synthase/poly-beta-1,6-N-acetylglucosamine synthase-like glycosyltransferase
MDTFRLVFALGLAVVAVGALLQLVWAYLDIPSLEDVPAPTRGETAAPRVSVIVAARDEQRHIESAVLAFLEQSYSDFELIVVDDRSSDGTFEILSRIATRNPRLSVVRVRELPPGWLGKNHALHTGASHASGALFLFADADVMLRPETLSRAVRLLRIERADHLAVAPDLVLPAWSLALVVNYFMMWFLLWLRPWKTRDPRSSAYVGIGAFNLVRATAYRAIGGHTRLRLRPDDDLMLGKLLKTAGYRQIVAAGAGAVSVEWYRTLGELARGFRKNAFAGLHYSMPLTLAAVVGNLSLGVWPFAAIWITSGVEGALYATAALAQMAGYAGPALRQRTRPWLAVLYPFASLIFVSILGAAVLRTVRRRGIEWRGTFYPLDELRANRV